jgi:hypothetical protein
MAAGPMRIGGPLSLSEWDKNPLFPSPQFKFVRDVEQQHYSKNVKIKEPYVCNLFDPCYDIKSNEVT